MTRRECSFILSAISRLRDIEIGSGEKKGARDMDISEYKRGREQLIRTEMLLGEQAMKKLFGARVAVFGIGGVGGYVVEALARSGIGRLDLIDHDTVSLSNLNRQIIATHDTIGQSKVEVMKRRVLSIAPACRVCAYPVFFLPENAALFHFQQYDYVVDAVDTVSAKVEIVLRAQAAGVPVISSMGTGNKLDPARLEVADIYQTSVCPLARVMRRELKARGVQGLKVVYSKEMPLLPKILDIKEGKKRIPGSTAFVPPAAGLLIAAEVVRDLISQIGSK